MSSTLVEVTAQPTVVPYYANRDKFTADVLGLLYDRLDADSILSELLHEKPCSREEFIKFVDQDCLLSIFIDLETARYVGLAWLANIEEAATLRKAWGSFAFFREFWDPAYTKQFGLIALSQWFNVLQIDLVCGLTPRPNRLAQRYCRRIGFEYKAVLPQYTSYHGETVDGLICMQTREEFNRRNP